MAQPTDAEAARWEEAVAGLAHRIEGAKGYLLALVVGAGEPLREAFTRDLGARLAPGFEVRPVAVTGEAPNPLQPLMDLAGIEKVVVVPYGLAALTLEQRKHTLHLLNWSRSQLTRRPMKVVLWVEPDIVAQLYQFAGDFADWWSELIELPEHAPEVGADPYEGRSRWELLEELLALTAEARRIRSLGGAPDPQQVAATERLQEAVLVQASPGQIVAGARLVQELDEGFWGAIDLESGAECLVTVLHDIDATSRMVHMREALGRSAAEDRAPAGLVRLLRMDRHQVAVATARPPGPTLPRGLAERGWSLKHRLDVVDRCIDAVQALERAGLCLRNLRPEHFWLDERDLPVLVDFDDLGRPGDRRSKADDDLDRFAATPFFFRDSQLSTERDVVLLVVLLMYVVLSMPIAQVSPEALDRSPNPEIRVLAGVARRSVTPIGWLRIRDAESLRERIRTPPGRIMDLWVKVFHDMPAGVTTGLFWVLASVALSTMLGIALGIGLLDKASARDAHRIDQAQIDTLTRENAALKEEIESLKDYIRLLEEHPTAPPPEGER